jgi:protein-tyrosine-phosphatase
MNGLIKAGGNLLRSPGARRLGQAVLATVVAVQAIRLIDKGTDKLKSLRQARKDAKAEANATVSAMAEAAPAPEAAPVESVVSETVQAVLDSNKYNELRKLAAERGINTNGWNKTQIAEALVSAAS